MVLSTLSAVIDRTITIDYQLMQSLRDNLDEATAPDEFIHTYLSENRSNGDGDDLFEPDSKIVLFNQQLAYRARDAMYLAIKYHYLNTDQLQTVQNLIKGICNDSTSPYYVYIKPSGMTSPNQTVSGSDPGSIVHLICNSDNDYSYCETLPFTNNPNNGFNNSTLSNYDRLYYASNGLAFVSFIYDMLYYEMTPTQRALATENIHILSGYLYNYLNNPSAIGVSDWNDHYAPLWANTDQWGTIIWEPEGFDKINIVGPRPYELLASLGYSRLVLGHSPNNDTILDWVMYMLDSVTIQGDFQGLLQYIVKKSGAFVNGYGYASQALKASPQLFYTALKRTTGINYWNNPYIKKMVNSTVDNLTPGYFTVPIEDCWWDGNGLDRGLMEYYYQNTDDPVGRSKIKWYLYRLKARQNNSWPSTKAAQLLINFPIVYSYNPENSLGPDDYDPPSSLSGIFSNQEYTHLSLPKQVGQNYETQAYKKRLWLHVTHESSYEEDNFHRNHEKGHYQVYYDNKQFIIDPGYRAVYPNSNGGWWRTLQWCRSIYSKNMLVVNPDIVNESTYINEQYSLDPLPSPATKLIRKRPVSGTVWNEYAGIENLVDDCKREYVLANKNIRHLKVGIKYNELPDETEDASYSSPVDDVDLRLFRNFYSLGNDGIIVYDKVTSLIDDTSLFRNQLHFHPSAVMNYDSTTGVFSAAIGSSKLYGAMGSQPASILKRIDGLKVNGAIADSLFPRGLPTGNVSDPITHSNIFKRAHSRVRVETESSIGSSFLTLLIPSSNAANPITSVVESSDSYLVYANIDSENQVYAGITNQDNSVINGLEITTDADLFYTRANSDFSKIKSMIINKGNIISVRDTTNTVFGEIELFHAYTDGIEEYIAEWVDDQLVVAISSIQAQYPRFKICRNGISSSNFSAKLLYSINWDETAIIVTDEPVSRGYIPDVIQSLAYDADYFYVNYSWQDLLINGQLPDGLVIAKGTVPAYQVSNNITFNGAIVLTGNLTIQQSGSLNILEGSQITVNQGVGIYNHGTLTINGGSSRSIGIGNENQTWAGITTYQNGLLNINQAIISNAVTGIRIRGNATVTNSKIKGCNKGIFVEVATPFVINGNLIKENTYGIDISNNFTTGNLGFIEENQITQNDYGVKCFNSNPYIVLNQICYNTQGGLLLSHYSEPILKNNAICFSGVTGTAMPEIHLQDHAYPVMDNYYNDINIDGDGYSLYYMQSSSRLQHLDARRNYWGLTDENLIRESIYPSRWDVEFRPYCLEPNNDFFYAWPLAFNIASQAELSGDLLMAKQLYADIISTNPQSVEAIQSLGRLNSIYAGAPAQFSELHSIYDSYFASCSDSVYVDLASGKRVMLDRFDRLYQQALGYYEERLTTCSTGIDSLYCLLDIAYTVEEMLSEDQGKSALEVNYSKCGLQISSLSEARQTIDHLWEQIMANTVLPSEVMVPVPHKLDITNYPNPFNPSTTISFAVPERGNVKLSIYNIKGQKVRELLNEHMGRGFHKVIWDGRDSRSSSVASGMYFVVLEVNRATKAKKIMLMK